MKITSQEIETFQCDQCDYRANCKVSLNKHIAKEHKVIPQIDGLNEYPAFEDKSLHTEDLNVRDSEVQTQFTDIDVTVKWGESDTLTLPPGTVVLKYENSKSKNFFLIIP